MGRSGHGASAFLCAACLVLAGCGGVGGGDEEPAGGEGVRITTMGFGLPDEHATARVDAFREANPDVEVRVNEGGFDEQQFLSAVAAGDAPDVVYVDRNRIGSLAARGAIEPIDDCVEREKIDLGQYREQAVRQVRLDDKVYGLPEFHMVRVLILNNAVLREAGVSPEEVMTTDWGRLPDVTGRLAKVDGGALTRIGFDPKIPDFLPMWVDAAGGELVSGDGTPKLDSPEVEEAVRLGVDLVARQGGWAEFSAFRESWDFFGANNQYVAGQLAAMPMEAWYINTLAANSPGVDVTIAPFTDREGRPISYATGQAWAIPQGSPHPEQACRFMATMTATDTWVRAAEARRDALAKENKVYSGTYTANTEADRRIFEDVYTAKDDPIIDAGVQVALSVQDSATSLAASPASYELVEAYTAAVNRVLNGQQELKEALAQAQREAVEAAERAGK
ncbi:MAG TPA: extracellular solute-binding protein [Pseudonocardiaceae bacterium]